MTKTLLLKAHGSIIALAASTTVTTMMDLGAALRTAQHAGQTFVPPDHRQDVIKSLEALKTEVGQAKHLKKPGREQVLGEIANAITLIGKQPDTMPAENGHDTAGASGIKPHVAANALAEKGVETTAQQ